MKITGKVVGFGDLKRGRQKPGDPAYIDIKPEGATKHVRVETTRGSQEWKDALDAHLKWADFTFDLT